MINVQSFEKERDCFSDEKELLQNDAEHLRNFYSLTGESRKEYIIKMAEAEAERIRIVRRAQAEGILAIRQAEAEGYRRIGEALAHIETRELVVKLAGLMALQQVSQSLADGKATKLFLPQNLGDIFALIAGWQETLAATGSLPAAQAAPERQ
ncbi:MAG: hypothetical protein DKINENOH_01259 [bacterium]|nr:hypothetical protein [bacterium]MCK6562074.1 hypothetical protein [bacterium]NUM64324.1 hypothetical protein [candidate division KSB1 bacterium]